MLNHVFFPEKLILTKVLFSLPVLLLRVHPFQSPTLMFNWVQPEKRRFFTILLVVVCVEIIFVLYLVAHEHQQLALFRNAKPVAFNP